MEPIAFFGLGHMGGAMATRLVDAGHDVKVYNRTPDKARPLVEKGATHVDHPADAVTPGAILVTMVADDNAQQSLVSEEVLGRLGKGGLHLAMSTVSPAAATAAREQHARHDVEYLACPVFGRPDAAAAGKLWLALAGPDGAKSRVRPLLDVMGQGVFDFGSNPTSANVVKLAGNFLIVSAIEAMAEALSLCEKNEVDPAGMYELFSSTLFACPIYQNYGRAIVDQRFSPPGFALAMGSKDVRLVRDAARAAQVPMPLAGLLEDRFLRSLANGRADLDWTGIALDERESAGLGDA
ncbi:MAG TPA: NAD(P)-dependent oxidoreductase [Gammaproteobacteria bacterium]|nr:NAD(P)-dependent oxidoreductase [Gammaproteobacteria bacterium]